MLQGDPLCTCSCIVTFNQLKLHNISLLALIIHRLMLIRFQVQTSLQSIQLLGTSVIRVGTQRFTCHILMTKGYVGQLHSVASLSSHPDTSIRVDRRLKQNSLDSNPKPSPELGEWEICWEDSLHSSAQQLWKGCHLQ